MSTPSPLPSESRRLLVALAIYLTSLFAANTLGLKIMPFLFGSHLSVAVFSFPIVFLATDVVGEVYGKSAARWFVLAGFVSTALFMVYSVLSLALPWAAAGEWVRASYTDVFGISVRVSLASLVAFGVAEYQDVVSFFLFKHWWGSRLLWLRSFLSNLWSQLLDSALFMVIAFAGVYTPPLLVSITLSWWLYKVAMGLVYTPLIYVGVWLLRGRSGEKV